ncbi:hypothetical protein [Sorangium sp. So ce426]|uniref:hypothetical protein n=1 Tax=unclassified Sorangium TaxID=2621164 RepID=UPI003F5B7EAB
MKTMIKTLGAIACLCAGSLVMLDSGDASAAAFRRLGVGYCGYEGPSVVNTSLSSSTKITCTLPSDSTLEHSDIVTLKVYVLNPLGSLSSASACVRNPTGTSFVCGGDDDSNDASAILQPAVTSSVLLNPSYASWFPYVNVTLGAMSSLNGIKVTDY